MSHDSVFNLESMSLATEEHWFSEWEFGGKPWSETVRRNFGRCSPHLSAGKITTPTLVITNEQVPRAGRSGTSTLHGAAPKRRAVRRTGVRERGHWVLNPLDSRRWRAEVISWMHKYLQPLSP